MAAEHLKLGTAVVVDPFDAPLAGQFLIFNDFSSRHWLPPYVGVTMVSIAPCRDALGQHWDKQGRRVAQAPPTGLHKSRLEHNRRMSLNLSDQEIGPSGKRSPSSDPKPIPYSPEPKKPYVPSLGWKNKRRR